MNRTFLISDVFSTSWKYTKTQLPVLCGLLIGFTIIAVTMGLFAIPMQSSVSGVIISNLLSMVLGVLFVLGYFKNCFQALDGIEPQFSAYGQQARKILTFICSTILFSLIVSIGLVLLVIPGIYLIIRLMFAPLFIVEEDAGIIDSLSRSWEITKGKAGQLFLLSLAWYGVILLGALLLGIGIFIAIPFVYMMYCYTFRQLSAPRAFVEEV